jgi:hypothetical protein
MLARLAAALVLLLAAACQLAAAATAEQWRSQIVSEGRRSRRGSWRLCVLACLRASGGCCGLAPKRNQHS